MKYYYTHNNHFKFGYDLHHPYQKRKGPEDVFQFSYGSIQSPITDWRTANRAAAETIRANFDEPLWILFSGGTDSEVCIRSFLEAKVPVQIATLRFANNLNDHDLKYVEKFSSQYNIKVHYFDLDVAHFWESGDMLSFVDPVACVSPILACHLWLADQVQGVPIIAQGEPHLKKQIPDDYVPGVSAYEPSPWHLYESERLCALYNHFMRQNKPAVPGFFQYLPEQIYSFCFYNPIMKQLVNNELVGKLGTRTSKNKMVYQYYPEMESREKLTGFENLEALHDHWRKFLADRFPYNDQNARIEYADLKRMLTGSI